LRFVQVRGLQNEVSERMQAFNRLNADVASLEHRNAALLTENSSLRDQALRCESAERDLHHANWRITTMETQLRDANAEHSYRISQLQQQLQQQQAQAAQAQAQHNHHMHQQQQQQQYHQPSLLNIAAAPAPVPSYSAPYVPPPPAPSSASAAYRAPAAMPPPPYGSGSSNRFPPANAAAPAHGSAAAAAPRSLADMVGKPSTGGSAGGGNQYALDSGNNYNNSSSSNNNSRWSSGGGGIGGSGAGGEGGNSLAKMLNRKTSGAYPGEGSSGNGHGHAPFATAGSSPFANDLTSATINRKFDDLDRQLTSLMTEKTNLQEESER
jgi:TolA-binding protein